MQSSPETPIGTGFKYRSNKKICVLLMGCPMGGREDQTSGGPVRLKAVTTWLSEGPYWLYSLQSLRLVNNEMMDWVICNCSPAVMISRRLSGIVFSRLAVSASCWSATNGRNNLSTD